MNWTATCMRIYINQPQHWLKTSFSVWWKWSEYVSIPAISTVGPFKPNTWMAKYEEVWRKREKGEHFTYTERSGKFCHMDRKRKRTPSTRRSRQKEKKSILVLRDTHLLLGYCLLTRVLWRRMRAQVNGWPDASAGQYKMLKKVFGIFILSERLALGELDAVNSSLSHHPLIIYVYCKFVLVRIFPTIILAQENCRERQQVTTAVGRALAYESFRQSSSVGLSMPLRWRSIPKKKVSFLYNIDEYRCSVLVYNIIRSRPSGRFVYSPLCFARN